MADLQKDISDVQLLNNKITEAGNKVARFAYSSVAYDDNIIDGVQEYNFDNEQNVPVSTAGNLTVSDTLLDKGIRSQGSSIPRMFLNGMLGRSSYNLNKAQDFLKVILSSVQRSLTRDFCLYSPTAQYQYLDCCYMNYPGVEAGTLLFKRISSGLTYLVDVPPIKEDGTLDTTNWTVVSTGEQITDTGATITPVGSSSIVLKEPETTRTISNGLWVGQTVTLFNNTANTITVTDGSFTFTVLVDNKKSVTWNGTRWVDYSIPLGSQYTQRNATDDPALLFGGVWERLIDLQPELAGRYEREIAAGLVAGATAEQKLPNIYGKYSVTDGFGLLSAGQATTFEGVIFAGQNYNPVATGAGAQRPTVQGVDASLMNYGTEENPIRIYEEGADVHPNNYIATTWIKTGW